MHTHCMDVHYRSSDISTVRRMCVDELQPTPIMYLFKQMKPEEAIAMNHLTRAYKNLNKGGWSLKQRDASGKWVVVGHCTELGMYGATPYVSSKRHDHVRRGNHREVFAWLEGELAWVGGFESFRGREVSLYESERPTWCDTEDKCRVSFYPFAQEKRGFVMVDGLYAGEEFEGCSLAYFDDACKVWVY